MEKSGSIDATPAFSKLIKGETPKLPNKMNESPKVSLNQNLSQQRRDSAVGQTVADKLGQMDRFKEKSNLNRDITLVREKKNDVMEYDELVLDGFMMPLKNESYKISGKVLLLSHTGAFRENFIVLVS